jgi:hypothetical protein
LRSSLPVAALGGAGDAAARCKSGKCGSPAPGAVCAEGGKPTGACTCGCTAGGDCPQGKVCWRQDRCADCGGADQPCCPGGAGAGGTDWCDERYGFGVCAQCGVLDGACCPGGGAAEQCPHEDGTYTTCLDGTCRSCGAMVGEIRCPGGGCAGVFQCDELLNRCRHRF